MYSIYQQDNDVTYGVKKYILDEESDLQSLPTDLKKVKPGSMAYVVDTGDYYILNNVGQWKIFKGKVSGGNSDGGAAGEGDNAGPLTVF